jgi:hypothetical protein
MLEYAKLCQVQVAASELQCFPAGVTKYFEKENLWKMVAMTVHNRIMLGKDTKLSWLAQQFC